MGYPLEESPFAEAVRRELRKARGEETSLVSTADAYDESAVIDAVTPRGTVLVRLPGHPPLNSAHEAWAVILEELDEFRAEVWKKTAARDPAAMLKELVQVGAMAQRAAEDLGLIAGG